MEPQPSERPAPGTDQASAAPKKSLYRRYVDAKRGTNKTIPDEELRKYTGMTRKELGAWAADRPGVGGHRNAGDITAGPVTGLGGVATSAGYGGWGPDARGDLKFPPRKKEEGKGSGEDGK